MPLADTLTAREARGRATPGEDVLGMDRASRAFLRTLARLGAGAVGQVGGPPGTGRTEFMRRCLHWVESDRDALGAEVELHPTCVWYNAWSYGKHGNVAAGFVGAIARVAGAGPVVERARDLTNTLLRMKFDGTVAEGLGASFNPAEADPVDRVRKGFVGVVEAARGSGKGRVVVFVADLDLLGAPARAAFLDALRVLLGGSPDLLVVLCMAQADCDLVDLAVEAPAVELRRVGGLLRRHLGNDAGVRKAFGDRAFSTLAEALAWPGFGTPRDIERIAARVQALAEYVGDGRVAVGGAQWCWMLLTQRWPEFHRFVRAGGTARWATLWEAVEARATDALRQNGEVDGWLERDPALAAFLEGMRGSPAESIWWMEETLQRAGL